MTGNIWKYKLFTFFLLFLSVAFSTQEESSCAPDKFDCGDGNCIPKNWKCDGTSDCHGNHLDEQDCQSECKESEFNCGNNTLCIPDNWKCDGDADCPNKLDENPELCSNPCGADEFDCGNMHCIPAFWVCDGMEDCSETKKDEESCGHKTCSANEFRCENSQCIADKWRCDGDTDCEDGSDEVNCPAVEECSQADYFRCDNSQCIPANWHCDGDFDCEDHSDEFSCTKVPTGTVCESIEWTCNTTDQCIHLSWRCDGDADCFDDSDELNCTHTCASNEFKCNNNQCINNVLRCDGEIECTDGSDEENCDKSCDAETQFGCNTAKGFVCLPGEKVCDGINDCLGHEDERKCTTAEDPCQKNNGGCLQKCVKMFRNQHRCECYDGYRKVGNSSCEDINECENMKEKRCSQGCINKKGGYKCSCIDGYILEDSGFCRVNGSRPHLLVANRFDIRTLQVDTWWEQTVLEGLTSAVAVDFDYVDEYVFWTDISSEQILRAKKFENKTVGDQKVIAKDNVMTPDGIAVDWIYNHLYWTDAGYNRIEVMNYDGTMRKTLVTQNLDEPRAIVVDPMHGWMYWTDWGQKPMIARCGLNGKHMSVIVDSDIEWPNGLTIDYVDQRLFWVDAKLNKIRSVDTNGNHAYTVLRNAESIIHPFAITVFEDNLYWTDWKAESIRTVNKFRGDGYRQVAIGLHSPMDIHFYHEHVQLNGSNFCGNNNGQCSHFCLPAPFDENVPDDADKQNKFSCECPNNFVLSEDQKTCVKQVVDTSTPSPPISTSTKNTTYTESPNKVPSSNVSTTTAKPKPTVSTGKPVITTAEPVVTTEGGYTVINPTAAPNASTTTTRIEIATDSGERVGVIAGIVVAVVAFIFIVVAVIGFLIYKRYTKKNIKSMNFDNPVYRKTTEDQFMIPYGNRESHSRRDTNNPALQPLREKNPEFFPEFRKEQKGKDLNSNKNV